MVNEQWRLKTNLRDLSRIQALQGLHLQKGIKISIRKLKIIDTFKLFEEMIILLFLCKRAAKKKGEGNIYADTEYSLFVPHEGFHRPDLMRRATTLKMEGNMETMTEKCENFIEWFNVTRPEPFRLPTHLKLEGDLETSTECHDSYVPFVGVRRPELLKQTSHLKLEGEATFFPEYSEVFKQYDLKGKEIINTAY